jgi:hypothetical protein
MPFGRGGLPIQTVQIQAYHKLVNGMPPNPSLHPKCYSGLRPLPPSGELKR